MDPSIHLEERRDRRGRRLPALALLGVISLLGASLAGLFGFLEVNAAFGTVEDLEDTYICDVESYVLEFPAISRLSEIYTADGVLLGKLTERNSQPSELGEIPDVVVEALLSAEDADFYFHEGIDFKAIFRAALENITGEGGLQGGSTITQQVVKQNFLSSEQTIERKICEAVVAAELERRYTKDQILEFYMNSIFYGENAYGVRAAAQEYFGKGLSELSIAEAATIVTPIRSPSTYDIREERSNVVRARNAVIDQMEANGFISAAQAREAKLERLAPIEHRDFEELAPQVIIAAREEVLRDPKYGLGETYSERKRSLFGCPASDSECEGGGGLKIFVTVNYELQQEANRVLREWFRDINGPTGAIAMVDNETGAVKVMASGLEFGEDIAAGQRPYDLAGEGRRQAGSAFKPFALAAALESGSQFGSPITLGSFWDFTSPQRIDCGFPCGNDGSNIWTVSNAGGANAGGIRTLEQATYLSTNTVYAQVSYAVGPDKIVDVAHRMGIESPLNPVFSIALGTQSVSPLEMAAAYSTIANYGEKVDSYLVERIEDRNGNIVYQHEVSKERVLDEALAAAMVATMEQVVVRGTATRADIGRPQAGKTGTAQNFQDVWFMGYIPQYTTSVWVGHADAQIELVDFTVFNGLTGSEQHFRRAFGGTLAAPIWKEFMLTVTEDLPVEEFPPEPPGTSVYRQVPNTVVPDVMEITDAEELQSAIFKAGLLVVVEEVASDEPVGTVLEQTPQAETVIRQGRTVTVRVSTGEPPLMVDLLGIAVADIGPAISVFNEETGLQITWVLDTRETPGPEQWNTVVATAPALGEAVAYQQEVVVFIGAPPPPPPPEP
ncbi:MAG: transglycosylase domain-containing protein [Acidimicrobiia bacterium]